jgi:hypothetical protein
VAVWDTALDACFQSGRAAGPDVCYCGGVDPAGRPPTLFRAHSAVSARVRALRALSEPVFRALSTREQDAGAHTARRVGLASFPARCIRRSAVRARPACGAARHFGARSAATASFVNPGPGWLC